MLKTQHVIPRTEVAKFNPLTELTGAALDVAATPNGDTDYLLTWFVPDDEVMTFETMLNDIWPGTELAWAPVDEDVDYVAATRKNFPPLEVGPFFIARNDEPTPSDKIGISIPPNMAFGSGEHATTSGCLAALASLKSHPATGLDVGSGSAILAIAAAKLHGTHMVCTDNDPGSVIIGIENADANDVADKITYVEDATLTHTEVTSHAPYPLIFANILLQPLLDLSTGLVPLLADGGHLILSGFTTTQAAQIEACYSGLGLKLTAQSASNNWVTHTWQK